MTYIICGVVLVLMFLYLAFRKPIWIQQVTPSGKIVHICPICGEIWTPIHPYEVFPPDRCPHCGKKVKTYI